MNITIPNLLSIFRIVAAPFLILVGWLGSPTLFFVLFGMMLLSDALDGYFARKLHQTSKLGAKLDSLGDIATYLSVPFAVWWLWPEIILREAPFIIAAILIFIAPAFFSLSKFGELVSYHTWITKASALLMSAGLIVMLATGNALLFHIAVFFLPVEAIENIAITQILSEPKNNIRSFWHALKER
ncbi:MAG: CDP-alcohol phosphatidyltransferase family protein [Campylobacterota bacterium]|nr:CDP-alcohol phosphatidyltransferase family protein [Campylobacterota bacterium]